MYALRAITSRPIVVFLFSFVLSTHVTVRNNHMQLLYLYMFAQNYKSSSCLANPSNFLNGVDVADPINLFSNMCIQQILGLAG